MRIALFAVVGFFLGALVGAALPFGLVPFWDTVSSWLDALPGSCAGNEFCGERQFFGLLETSIMLGAIAGAVALGVVAARRRKTPRG